MNGSGPPDRLDRHSAEGMLDAGVVQADAAHLLLIDCLRQFFNRSPAASVRAVMMISWT
jgi:hypothetical protein